MGTKGPSAAVWRPSCNVGYACMRLEGGTRSCEARKALHHPRGAHQHGLQSLVLQHHGSVTTQTYCTGLRLAPAPRPQVNWLPFRVGGFLSTVGLLAAGGAYLALSGAKALRK